MIHNELFQLMQSLGVPALMRHLASAQLLRTMYIPFRAFRNENNNQLWQCPVPRSRSKSGPASSLNPTRRSSVIKIEPRPTFECKRPIEPQRIIGVWEKWV